MSNGVPTAQQVFQQVTALNTGSDAERSAADAWLQEFRRQPSAWAVLTEILGSATASPRDPQLYAVRLFAAQVVKWRVKKEKPEGALSLQLRQSIMAAVVVFAAGPKAVLTQLCLALVQLITFDTSDQHGLVEGICATLGRPESVGALLELLYIFGEEAGYRFDKDAEHEGSLAADDASPKRGRNHPIVRAAEASVAGVIGMLHNVWAATTAESSEQRAAVIGCFAQWLRFGGVPVDQLSASPITLACIAGMADDDLRQEACDVLCEFAYVSGRAPAQNMALVALLTGNLPTFYRMFQQKTTEEDIDAARLLVRAMSRIAASYAPMIAQASPDALKMIGMIIDTMKHPEREVFEQTFQFWDRLSDIIRRLSDTTPAADGGATSVRARRIDALAPALAVLPDALVRLGMTPEDPKGYDHHDMTKWRKKTLSDAIESCGVLVGARAAAQRAFMLLSTASVSGEWRQVEGVLVFLRYLDIPEYLCGDMMEQLFGNCAALGDHWCVRDAFTYLIGKFSYWLNESGQHLLPVLLPYVGRSCSDTRTAPNAAAAIHMLCSRCARHMLQQFAMLHSFCETAAGGASGLELDDQELLMQGLGTVVCGLPDHQLERVIETLWAPALQRIQTSGGSKTIVGDELQRLAALFKGVTEGVEREGDAAERAVQNAVGVVPPDVARAAAERRSGLCRMWSASFRPLWPVLHGIMQTISDENVIEQLTKLLRHVLKSCETEFRPHLEAVAGILVNCYRHKPWSSILWVTATIIGVFGNDALCIQPLLGLIGALTETTMQFLQANPVGPNSDFVTELFYLHDRAACRFLPELINAPATAMVFNVGIAVLQNTDVKREAVEKCLDFFISVAGGDDGKVWKREREAESAAAVAAFFGAGQPCRGQMLLTHGLAVCIDRNLDCSDRVAVFIACLMSKGEGRVAEWLRGGLAALPNEVPQESRRRCLDDIAKCAAESKEQRDYKYALEDLHNAVPKNWR